MSLEAERGVDLSYKMADLFLKGANTLLSVMSEALRYLDQDPMAKTLKSYMDHGGKLEFSICQKAYGDELERAFQKEGITYLRSNDMANGGICIFLYADRNRERAEQVFAKFRAEHGRAGIADQSVFWAYAKDDVRTLTGLSVHEAMLFSEKAEKAGILVSMDEPQKGVFALHYAGRDMPVLEDIKATVALELSGKSGEALKAQLDYENRTFTEISERLQQSPEAPFYVVDLSGNTMEVTDRGIRYEGDKGVITIDRLEEAYWERANELLLEFRNPTLLNQAEMERLSANPDKRRILSEISKDHGRPQITREEYLEAREKLEQKELYEMKLAMEDPDHSRIAFNIEDADLRLGTFEEFNDLNEEENRNIREDLFQDARRRLKRYQNLDRAEEDTLEEREFADRILDGQSQEQDFNREAWDLMHDKNNNYIPDEYERRG